MSPLRVIRKKMGELLIERDIITKEELEKALQEQRMKGGYLSQHLISLGFASEYDIAYCLSSQYGFPYLPLENYAIPSKVLEVIPFKLIKIYSLLPVDRMGEVLSVAMVDPLNDGVVEMLRQITNLDIKAFISTYSEVSQAIERYFGLQLKKQIDDRDALEEDQLRIDIAQPFIQTLGHSGIERRRYTRIDVDLDMVYFLEGKSYKAKIKNISFIGIFFICPTFIPIDTNVYTNIVSKIVMKDVIIYSVIQVVRVEKMKDTQELDSHEVLPWNYGIAGFFNFITKEDKDKLSAFLKNAIQGGIK